MQELTQQDYQVILNLIGRANITGQEATTVAILQQKLQTLATPKEESPKEESSTEKAKKSG